MNKNLFRKSVYKTFKKSFSKNASLKNASRKKSIVAFLLAAALLILAVGIASAAQTWDFDHDDVMYKGEAHTETGTVTIGEVGGGGSNIWRSEHAAQVDEGVAFDAETWNGQLECTDPSLNKKFTVEIGIWNGSSFTSKGKSAEYDLNHWVGFGRAYQLSASGFTVPNGQWLAARVNSTGTEDFTLITDGSCYITYPPDHPDYPVPELPTIILMSTGLLALAGYVVYSRSRRRNGKAE